MTYRLGGGQPMEQGMETEPDIAELFERAYRRRDADAARVLHERLPALLDAGDRRGAALACLGASTGLASGGRIREARRLVDEGLLLLGSDELELRLELLNNSAVLLLEEGRTAEALEPLLLVPRIAGPGHERLAARATINLAFCLLEVGDLDGAEKWAELAYGRKDGFHDPSHALWVLTEVAEAKGDDEAMAWCEERLLALQPTGAGPRYERRVAARLFGLAKVALWREEWDTAIGRARAARDAFVSTSMNEEPLVCGIVEARGHLGKGDLEAARRGLWVLRTTLTAGPLHTAELEQLLARVELELGHPDRAVPHVRRALELREELRRRLGVAIRVLTERHQQAAFAAREAELTTLNSSLKRTLQEVNQSREALQRRVDEATRELRASLDTLQNEVEERRRAQMAALAANEAKSMFLAKMSHELRTPLNAIRGYAELLGEEIAPELAGDVDAILRATGTLVALIDDLLDLVRIESDGLSLSIEAVELDVELAPTLEEARCRCRERGLGFTVDGTVGRRVLCDPARTRQVLANLLSNAVKFTREGEIRVRLREVGDHVRIAVSDTGIGLRPEDAERVFLPFEQVDAGFTRRAGGTGVGLAVGRYLVGEMGGELTVESQVGCGSTFVFTLPLEG